MVLAGVDFPPDIRVEKEARTLREAGHQVTVVCRGRGGRPQRDTWEGCAVVRIPERRPLLRRVDSLRLASTFRDPRWRRALDRLLAAEPQDVVHVHDLPMLATAADAAERHGCPVVADLHENYPDAVAAIADDLPLPAALLWRAVHRRRRWVAHERRVLRRASRVVVVVQEARVRLVAEGADPGRIVVVENTTDAERLSAYPLDEEVVERFRGGLVISYVGGLSDSHRGVDLAVSALPRVLDTVPDARLLVVGGGRMLEPLRRLASRLGVAGHVVLTGPQPFALVPSFIAASDVCLVPHRRDPHTDATSPHKLFQYMLFAKPVIVSDCAPLRRVVEETGAGLVFPAGDAAALADAILQLRDPAERARLGAAGRRAVLDRYNWRRTSSALVALYDELAAGLPTCAA